MLLALEQGKVIFKVIQLGEFKVVGRKNHSFICY